MIASSFWVKFHWKIACIKVSLVLTPLFLYPSCRLYDNPIVRFVFGIGT